MELRWTVRGPGRPPVDVRVDAPAGTPWSAVAGPLAAALDGGDEPADPELPGVWCSGRQVEGDDPVGRGSLRSGAVLDVGAPVAGRGRGGGGLQLRVVAGPDAGAVHPLRAGTTVVGRSPVCDVVLADEDASRTHVELTVGPEGVVVRDRRSTNGTTLDGRPLGSVAEPWPPGAALAVGAGALRLVEPDLQPAAVVDRGDGSLRVSRPPRLRGDDAPAVVRWPPPPPPARTPRLPWLALGLPALLGLVLVLVLGPFALLFVLLAPVTALGTWAADRASARRDAREADAAHAAAVAAARGRVDAAAAVDRGRREEDAPDLARLLAAAEGPDARLWERRRDDADRLHLRLGLGSLPARVEVLPAAGAAPDGSAAVPAPPLLAAVPVTVALRDVGVLGVAGTGPVAEGVVRSLVAQLAVLHSPRDVVLVVLADDHAAAAWRWARWLPHVDAADAARGGGPRAAAEVLLGLGAQAAATRTAELAALVAARAGAASAGARPVLDGPDVVAVVVGARALRSVPGLAAVLADGPAVGVRAVCLDVDRARLPEECGAVLDLGGATGLLDVGGRRTSVAPDGLPAARAERLARALAPLRDDDPGPAGADALPDDVALDALLPLPDAAALASRWELGPDPRAVVGLGLGGRTEVLDLPRDGPHALVAGTTGSGKSELLRTLVASLALGSAPQDLAFVLVDFKGGAAFGPLAALPHVAGVVTDLDEAGTRRALGSLDAELRRREAVLAAAGADRLDDLPAGPARPPRLVVVVDEFASLVEELPGFVPGLVGLAARGRSLGLHLVLATQRPRGAVSADVRANTALRVCLAVADAEESRDVLDVPDAALLGRRPGRGFVRRAGGGALPFQAARVRPPGGGSVGGGSVGGGTADGEPAGPVVRVHLVEDDDGPTSSGAGLPPDREERTVRAGLDAVVARCLAAADLRGLPLPPPPWLPPLPETLPLTDLPPADLPQRPAAPSLVFGLVDDPDAQRQHPLVLDLGADGHLLVVGAPRSGRTTTLRTVVAAALRAGPGAVHLVALDAGGGGLADLAALPSCGAVVDVADLARVARLLDALRDEVTRRRGSGAVDPSLLVLVDRVEAVQEALTPLDGGRLLDGLLDLLRDGPAVGVHVVLTAERAALSGRLAALCDRRLVLRLPDPADLALVGVPHSTAPPTLPPGRGYTGSPPLLVQVALPPDDLATLAPRPPAVAPPTDATGAARGPLRVDPMPATAGAGEPDRLRRRPRPVGAGHVALGVGGDVLGPVDVDLVDAGPGFLVAGPARSGRTTTLLRVASSLREQPDPLPLVLVAPRPGGLRRLEGTAGVRAVVRGPEDAAVLEAALAAPGPLALLVDDAEHAVDGALGPLLAAALGRGRTSAHGPAVDAPADEGAAGDVVVLAGSAGALAGGFSPVLVAARRAGCGLLLQPGGPLDGDLLGVRLPAALRGGPPGRGVLVVRGAVRPVQVAPPP